MSKVCVVYWSGTGNTEAMANLVAEGAKAAGAETDIFTAGEFSADQASAYDALAFGCPSMGSEELEDTEFAPMFQGVLGSLAGKNVGLFGSYGWGDGEWMRTWQQDVRDAGIDLVSDGVIANEAPDDEAAEACRGLGASLAG